MAIKIELRRQQGYFTLQEEIETRIDVALDALQYIMRGENFSPSKLIGWANAPMEELGGKKFGEEPISIETVGAARDLRKAINRFTYLMKQESNAYAHSIFRIEGVWNLNGVKTDGFFSINNDADWQSAYGDIDIDGYPTGKYDDFLDIFWDNKQVRDELVNGLFNDFVQEFASKSRYQKIFDIRWICFANGVPSQYEMPDIKAVYYDGVKSLVDGMFFTFSERNKKLVQKSLSRAYLVKRHIKSRTFQEQMQAMIIQSNMNKKKGSLILVADEKDSFAKLYKTFAKNYLETLYTKLPVDDQVNRAVEDNIQKNQALFSNMQSLDELFDFKEEKEDADEDE